MNEDSEGEYVDWGDYLALSSKLQATQSKLAQYAQAALAPENEVRKRIHELASRLHQLSEDHSHCEDLLHELGERSSRAEGRLGSIHRLMTDKQPDRPAEVQFGVLLGIMERVIELSKPVVEIGSIKS